MLGKRDGARCGPGDLVEIAYRSRRFRSKTRPARSWIVVKSSVCAVMKCILTDSVLPRQPRKVSLLEQELTKRPNRRAPEDLAGGADMFTVQHAALASDDRLVIDFGVFADSDLTADQAI